MARQGTFNLTAYAPTWFDATATADGWVTEDLVVRPAPSGGSAALRLRTIMGVGRWTFDQEWTILTPL